MPDARTGKPFLKTACQWLVILVITLGLGEIVARFYNPPGRLSWMLEKNEKIITFMGLPQLNETMEFDPFLFWRLKNNLDRFQITGHILDHDLDFFVSTFGHLRTPPFSTAKRGKTVLALGDSCTFGLGVNDGETWPAQLQSLLDQQGMKVTVINAGVPGYSAFQGKRFLEKNLDRLSPDLVVACFGFNDREPWKGLSDIDVARRMRADQQEPLIKNSRLYLLARYAAENALYKARYYLKDPGPRGRLSETAYRDTIKEIKQLCDQKNITLVCMIWPYHFQISSQSGWPVFYQVYTADICRQEHIECVNLISPFINEAPPLYIDHIHANPDGCRLVARTVLPVVVRQLAKD